MRGFRISRSLTTTVTTVTHCTPTSTEPVPCYRAWSEPLPPPGSVGVGIRFHPLRIRHAVWIECSEPSRLVRFLQLDQRKRFDSDFASASHAEGRWFDPSRDHFETVQSGAHFCDLGGLDMGRISALFPYLVADDRRNMGLDLPFSRRVLAEGHAGAGRRSGRNFVRGDLASSKACPTWTITVAYQLHRSLLVTAVFDFVVFLRHASPHIRCGWPLRSELRLAAFGYLRMSWVCLA